MLANDSNEQKRQGRFSLLVNANRGVAELMAECPKCGAITMYGLELAWRLQNVTCPECGTSMRLTGDEPRRWPWGGIPAKSKSATRGGFLSPDRFTLIARRAVLRRMAR